MPTTESTSARHSLNPYDILIAGAGVVGATLALFLANQGFSITVVERQRLEHAQLRRDFRGIALTAKSKETLTNAGIWDTLYPHTSPILHIRINDGDSPHILDFTSDAVAGEAMGHMILNYHLLESLHALLAAHPNITLYEGETITALTQDTGRVTVQLDSGNTLEASLLLAADGKHSSIRKLLHIPIREWDYHHRAIVTVIRHALSHEFTAQERFYPHGPFAVLPLPGQHLSAIVWVEKPETVDFLMQLETPQFLEFLREKFGTGLGTIELASTIHHYPLTAQHATDYYQGRVVLVGDAAHTVHPIAGQGLNLGFADVESCVRLIRHAADLGMDLGDSTLWEEYTAERRPDNAAMLTITHQLEKIFGNQNPVLRTLRRTGLSAIRGLPTLRRHFIRYAMGVRG